MGYTSGNHAQNDGSVTLTRFGRWAFSFQGGLRAVGLVIS